jgi:uncharacterized protein (TIGR02145 family)
MVRESVASKVKLKITMKNTLIFLLIISGVTCQAQITDLDGNSYDTVRIGNQTWMAENLNVSHFRNGDTIPEAKTDEDWVKASENEQPAWCYYENDTMNGVKYGKLYNWYAVNDPRSIAPVGYRIPTDAEWTKLIDYLGGESEAAKKMKSTSGWHENGNGINTSGFSGLPGGNRGYYGTFRYIGGSSSWWSSSENITVYAWFRGLSYFYDSVEIEHGNKGNGYYIRCLRD